MCALSILVGDFLVIMKHDGEGNVLLPCKTALHQSNGER